MAHRIKSWLVAVGLALGAPTIEAQERSTGATDGPGSSEEMWRIIRQQSEQIRTLQEQVAQLKGRAATTDQRVEAIADAVEEQTPASRSRTHIGGYGEIHYNNLEDRHGTRDKNEVDFHRFVGFISHEFSDRIRFFSELELEHSLAGDGKPGEAELEQAYVELDLGADAQHRVKAGLFLVPVGLLNESHEPPTFHGTERNSVEHNIIPTTWWEGGLGITGALTDTLSYDLAYTSGLAVADDYKIRGGRQKVAKATATDGAYTGRLRWRSAGIELGTTLHFQSDLTQGGANGAPQESEGLLVETHATVAAGRFGLRALYARWELDAEDAEALGRNVQEGWYLEPSLRITGNLGLFARYSMWDNEAGDSDDSEVEEWTLGLSYWPHQNVVLKLDYQNQNSAAGQAELDGLNVALGFQF